MDKVKSGLLWFFKSFIWLGVLLLVIDIVTKNVIIANKDYIMNQPNGRIDLIPGFLGINYTINTSAAFGIGLGNLLVNRIVYIVLALIVCAVVIAVYVKKFKRLGKLYKACMMLILVGAFGNVIDRVFFTPEYLGKPDVGVVDWIDFYGIWRYIFNIADSAIVIGVIMLIVVLIVEEVRDRKQAKVVLSAEEVHAKKEELEAKVEEAPVEEEAPNEEAPVTEEKVEEEPLIEEKEEKKPAPKKSNSTKKTTK